MSNVPQVNQAQSDGSMKMLQVMVGIGILCALLIVLAFEGTQPRIAKLKAEALERAIFKVLPGAVTKETFKWDEQSVFSIVDDNVKEGQLVYAGYDAQHKLVGVAVEASGIGFADVIRVLYGYSPEQEKIIGFYVLESKETPGLGDKIEKDPGFLANFEALDVSVNQSQQALNNTVVTVKHGAKNNPWEIDGITGATISSRAIGNIMGTSTAHWVPLISMDKEAFVSESNK